ncbi:dynamin family protein [Streptomyces sp. NPDC059479]|uniref:dynamin family protein n=1 Tax=Streptomyces sp. NPDC059479 TaxID=3346848 RepID=UPI0036BE65E6
MDGGRWLDMSALPDVDPDEAVSEEALHRLRELLRETAASPIEDENWARMLSVALDGTDQEETAQEETATDGTAQDEAHGATGSGKAAGNNTATGSHPVSGHHTATGHQAATGHHAAVFDRLRGEVLALFPPLTDATARLGGEEALARLDTARERLADGRLTVVVCGEFNRGKSSLLNALLEEEPPLFPVETSYTTNVVTTVSYGPAERITVTLEDDSGEVVEREIDRSEIAAYVTESGNTANVRRALTVQIRTPNTRLASGLTLVDTPGIGGVHQDHTAATAAFLPSADALVFVTDVVKPLTDSELAFLRRAMKAARTTDDTDGQIFVLTKIDAVPDHTELLRNTVDKLTEATGLSPAELTLLPVSSRAKLDHLVSGDPEDLELSNFTALENTVWAALSRRRAKLLLGGALTGLESCALSLLRPVEAEAAALGDRREEELRRLTEEFTEQQRRLDELDDGGSRWRADLRAALGGVEARLRREAHNGLAEVWAQVGAEYLYQEVYLDNPDRLLSEVTAQVAQLLGTANELAAREAARVVREFSTYNGLNLTPARIGRLPDPPVPALPPVAGTQQREDAERRKLMGSSVGLAAGSSAGAAGGATIGALVGTLLMPGLGTATGAQWGAYIGSAVGGLLGTRAGYVNATKTLEKEQLTGKRDALRRALAPLRKEQERHLDNGTAEVIQEWSRAVVAELDSRIAQERETAARALVRLDSARDATAREALTRRAELDGERALLDGLRLRIAALTEEADLLYVAPERSGEPGTAAADGNTTAAPGENARYG